MASLQGRVSLSLVAAALAAGPLCAADFASHQALHLSQAKTLGARLGADHSLVLRGGHADELGMSHARFAQVYRGVPVFGGELVTHMDKQGKALAPTQAVLRDINLNVTPSITADEALAAAHRTFAPKAAYKSAPQADLMVYPEKALVKVRPGNDATAFEERVVRYHLAYVIRAKVESPEQTAHQVHIVDAHTGALLKSIDDLHTAAVVGTGKSQWYGTVSLNTNSTSTGYEMRDMTRGTGGTYGNNVTLNMKNGTSGNGTIFTDADNTWGDGLQYNGTAGTGDNAQTAGVDGHRGLQATWDFYKNVLGRNGIDNTGKATYNRMHYSSQYDNAFWDDSCFCMTYGDGATGGSVGEADLDTAGHEMSHGVCATTANLTYSGESGGLNESNSDIFGTCVEFWTLGNGTTTVPDSGSIVVNGTTISANYTMFENSWGHPGTALRYMYKPSLDGASKDAWSSTLGSLDVHYSSGPNNRMWYFLARGASSSSSSDFYSSYLPGGMTGVGNDHAARIWYRALTTYLTSSSNYAAARTAAINAAKDLYGAGSAEEAAVWNAYAAINVGSAWSGSTQVAVSVSPTTASVTTGATKQFTASVTGTTNTAVTWSVVEAGGGTVSSTGLYTAPATAGTYHVKATSAADTTKSATATVTVSTSGGVTITISPASVGVNPGATQQFTASVSGTTNTAVTWSVVEAGGGSVSSTGLYTAPTTAGTYHVKVTSAADATKSATATVSVPVIDNFDLIKNGGFESGATSWSGTTGDIGTWSGQPAHAGTKDAWICGNGSTATESLSQTITVPAAGATLTFWLHIDTAETTTSTAYDKLAVQVINGTTTSTLATYSNLNKATGYVQKSLSLAAYAGKTITIKFNGTEDSSLQTSFVIDDVSAK